MNNFKTYLFLCLLGLLVSCNTKPKESTGASVDSTVQTPTATTEAPEVTTSTEVVDEPAEPSAETPKGKTELDAIDQVYEDCMGTAENQTTVGMCDCAAKAQAAWDKEMNEYYNALMRALKEDEKGKLKIAQQKWLAFRDAEFDFFGMSYYNMEGTMYRVMAVERQKEFVKARAQELKLYYLVFVEGQ